MSPINNELVPFKISGGLVTSTKIKVTIEKRKKDALTIVEDRYYVDTSVTARGVSGLHFRTYDGGRLTSNTVGILKGSHVVPTPKYLNGLYDPTQIALLFVDSLTDMRHAPCLVEIISSKTIIDAGLPQYVISKPDGKYALSKYSSSSSATSSLSSPSSSSTSTTVTSISNEIKRSHPNLRPLPPLRQVPRRPSTVISTAPLGILSPVENRENWITLTLDG